MAVQVHQAELFTTNPPTTTSTRESQQHRRGGVESNICNVYLDIYTLDSQHGVATWTSTWDSHIPAIILQLDPSDRYLHQLLVLEAESVSYIVNLGHAQVALHIHLASDLATLQHQIDKMSDNIVLQVQHRNRQSRKTHHKMLMEHLQENIKNNDINFICLEAVGHVNSQRALHRQDTSASSSLTSTKGISTTNRQHQVQQQQLLHIHYHQLPHQHLQHQAGQHLVHLLSLVMTAEKALQQHLGQLRYQHLPANI